MALNSFSLCIYSENPSFISYLFIFIRYIISHIWNMRGYANNTYIKYISTIATLLLLLAWKRKNKEKEKCVWDHTKELPLYSLRGSLCEAPHIVIIHVKRTRWTVNEPFCEQIDGQNRADHAQCSIDLGSSVKDGFEGFRLVGARSISWHQNNAVVIAAAQIRFNFQLTRHPSEMNHYACYSDRTLIIDKSD